MVKKEPKRGFVWYSLRIAFFMTIALTAVYSILGFSSKIVGAMILGFLSLIFIAFTFVVSIIHLINHEKKAFPIIAIVFSSICGLMFLIVFGFIVGSAYYSSTTLINDTDEYIAKGYFQSYSFDLDFPSYLNLNFSSDSDSNIYILEPNEYSRYENGEPFYYTDKSENATIYSFENSYFSEGTYYVAVEGVNSSVKYNISIDYYPY